MNLESLYKIYLECEGTVATDSRSCPKDSLFFALKGDKFDGNKYALNALECGAKYAVVDNPNILSKSEKFILVEDSLQTLQELAKLHRRILKTPIIGITGTNGKTTTKELIANVLSTKYCIQYTKGNLNNHIGVPLTLLSIKPEHGIAVVEMGANHPGEIAFLCNIVEPDYGIITNVGKAHLEGFGSFEGVVKTKGELYNYLAKRTDTTVFIDSDNKILRDIIAPSLRRISYGTHNGDIIGRVEENSFTLTFNWKESEKEEIHYVETQLVGNYNLQNALASIAIGRFFDISIKDINNALTTYTPQNNRSQFKKTSYNDLIIDAYNANPTSMTAALTNFLNISKSNKVAIIGDMKELGKDSLSEHQTVINLLTKNKSDKEVILVGEEFGHTLHNFKHYNSVNELYTELKTSPLKGKTILIKGSNSIKLSTIIDLL